MSMPKRTKLFAESAAETQVIPGFKCLVNTKDPHSKVAYFLELTSKQSARNNILSDFTQASPLLKKHSKITITFVRVNSYLKEKKVYQH